MKILNSKLFVILLVLTMLIAACGGSETTTSVVEEPIEPVADAPAEDPVTEPTKAPASEPTEEPEPEPTEEPEPAEPETIMRDSGLMITVQPVGDIVVHTATSPEAVFANSTHIIETPNNLVVIDTQFLLPNALDFRAYADSLGKPIERVIITHEHPDHFLGSEAFADLDVYALAEVSEKIEANGQAEVDEKQADFGDAIASTYAMPNVLEPGTVEIDGVTFVFESVANAEAEIQLVTTLPDYDVVSVGDIVYSGVHLILAGSPPTWIEALDSLNAVSTENTYVLPGHGVPSGADLYDANVAWLMTAGALMEMAVTGEEFKAGLVEAFPELGMDAAIDFVLPFIFPEEVSTPTESTAGLIEVITVELAEGATVETFLPTDQVIKNAYASLQPGYLARETAVSEDGLVRLAIHWESKADSDASIAGFGEAPGLEAFMSNLNPETMVIKQYELLSSTSGQITFPGAGATEAITVRLQDGADTDSFLAANKAIEENYIVNQPGFIAREIGVTEDGEWLIVIHWESVEDSAASIAKFGEAPGVEEFMSFLDADTMTITVFDIQQEVPAETMTRESGLTVTVQNLGDIVVHSLTAPEQVFADSTHIIETPNSLVLMDTQFLLPMALDYRAYANSLGKPIDRLVISHEHPDHFLGGEAFADVPMYALAETVDLIAANGPAEIDEKQADFGDAIASTFVVPEILEPGAVEIDGVTFEFSVVKNAEAETQLVTAVPEYDVVYAGDIVYSGVHLIMAGAPPTWTEALENLKAESSESTVVLAGHGLPGTAGLYDENIAWLAKAGELLGTVSSGEEFKAGLVEAFPELGMDAAIDFVLPFLFPTE